MSVASEQNNCDVHLHAEIEALKQALIEKQNQLIAMETACLRESDRQVELEDSIIAWQDKYDRLYESHKRVQKVNQSLEDKLLKLVDRNSGERAQLTSDVATLSVRLAQANYNIAKLQREIERYKTDINLAIQLLQCKPDSFVPQKVSSLPMDIQSKVSTYMRLETNSHSDSEGSTSGVGVATSGSYKVLPASDSPPPVCPFPPTAMVYSMRGLDAQNNECTNENEQMISPSIMAKYLEDELKASEIKHCDTCNCSTKDLTVLADEPKTYSVGTQTMVQGDGNSLCLRCNSNLNSPSRTNSPYIMKLVKSSDSVISETKSSVSDLNDAEKLFTPAKKDDLMVNPILGHHRLCDRTTNKQNQLCDTAKYLLENRKIENDLIDLRKYSNKSPNAIIGNDINNSFSRNLISDKVINDASRKSDSNNILVDTRTDNVDTNSIQGNGENAGNEKKSDLRLNQENGSSGYSSTEKGNLQTTITGSTNSLWSKTSSSEGAKLFENFNRNLIKTIKAENPKYRGPRLCALRIQNGSNNILLDNIESEVTPIVYTRRQRFLDEELDDTKDIITSKISMVMSNQTNINTPLSTTSDHNTTALNTIVNFTSNDNNKTDNDKYCDVVHSKDNTDNIALSLVENDSQQQQQQQQNNIIISMLINSPSNNQHDINSDRNLGNASNQMMLTNNCLEQHCNGLRTLNLTNDICQQQLQNYDIITLCDNSGNTKSCTQSSSMSSNGADIDLQENALLRRQQLNRVAEWVQNNSQIENASNNNKNTNINPSCGSIHIHNITNCNNDCDIDNMPSSASVNSNSVEKISVDSGYKTTKQLQNEVCSSSNINNVQNINITSPISVYNHTQLTDDNKAVSGFNPSHLSTDKIAQNNFFLNRKYYIDENGKNYSLLSKQLSGGKSNSSQTQVDLAQMEYNVKQFLLKQNEWSIRNKSTNSSVISNGKNSSLVSNCNSTSVHSVAIKSQLHRTETNL